MKRSTKQLLSLLLTIVMVFGLMAPAMAAKPMMGDVAETPTSDVSGAKLSGSSRPAVSAPAKAELLAAGDKKTLNASTMTAFAAGGKADGDTEVVDGFFTVHYGAKDKVDANSKTFDDGFAGTQRLNFGAISDFTKGSDYIEFTIAEPTLVKLWWVHNKGARHTAIIKEADTAFADPVWDSEGGADNQLRMDSAYLTETGKYFIAFPTNETNPGGNYIFKVEAIALATEPTETKGTLGTPSITVAENKDKDGNVVAGKYDVTVSGVAIGKTEDATTYNTVQNAEKVVVSAYKDGATEACLTSTITKWTAADGTNTVTLDVGSQGTGSYTFKAVASQGDSTTESALSSAVSYTLPLAKPALTATAGNAKVTLSWAAVKEATSYEVYQGDTKLTGEPTLTSGVYYLEVTGLTNGTAYSFTVKAIRETPAADATSDAATATPVAPTEGGEVTVNKYSLDATKVAKEDDDKKELAAADLTAATTLSVDGGAATEGVRYFGITLGETTDKGATVAGTVLKRSKPTKGLEIFKQGAASIDFTVKGEAKVTLNLASTNGTNVSMFALVNDAGAVQMPTLKHAYTTSGNKTSSIADGSTAVEGITPAAGVVVVCGYTATAEDSTIVEYTLPAGTYHMQSYAQFTSRAVWLLGADVEDSVTATPVTKVYDLDATKVAKEDDDKKELAAADLTAATTMSVDGGAATEGVRYFGITLGETTDKGATVAGTVLKRSKPTKGLEIFKQGAASIDFTVKGEAKVTLNLASTNATNVSMFALVNDAGAVQVPTLKHAYTTSGNKTSSIADGSTVIESITPAAGVVVVCGYTATADDSTIVEYTLPAGTYHMQSYAQFTSRAVWLLGANVSDTYMDAGELEENIVDWTVAAICGTPKYTTSVDATKGTITVNVVGPKVGAEEGATAIDIYADKLSIVMYNADGTEIASVEDNAEGNTHKGVFTPVASGKYTFKVRVSRTGETDLLSAASDEVDFILPLATPAISSAASNGKEEGKETASVTLMWAKVPEATNYNVRYKEHGAADWGAATKIDAPDSSNVSYVVTGLTVGKAYDFQAQAIRNTEESAWSAVFEGNEITATKQTAWTEVVFGTSATAASNNVVGDKTTISYTGIGKEKVTAAAGTYTLQYVDAEGKDKGEPRVIKDLTGDLNKDPEGRVLLSSRDGAGKIKEDEFSDGQLFYYTAIPAGTNYTLKADVEVLRWATRDTQNGVGLAAMDRVAAESWTGSVSGNAANFGNNTYMVGAARTSFDYDSKTGNAYGKVDLGYGDYTRYSYYMGLISIAKNGVPMTANGPYNDTAKPTYYYERRFPLDLRLARDGRKVTTTNGNRFNVIGNYTVQPAGFSLLDDNSAFMKDYELTQFTLQIQKNNTGYITTVWDKTGKQLGQNIEYFVKGAMDLSGDKPYHDDDLSGRKDIAELQQCLDSDYEYVGLFTSRDMDALFTNVKLTTIAAEDDAAPVSPPIAQVTPQMKISSGGSSNTPEFKLSITANVEGTVTVTQNSTALPGSYEIKANAAGVIERLDIDVTLRSGNNSFVVNFQPDPDQVLPPFTELKDTRPIKDDCRVIYSPKYAKLTNIYAAPYPTGSSTNYGTKDSPLDVHTAVSVVRPGQNIILLEGVYNLDKPIRINRGMDGAETIEVEQDILDEEGNPTGETETKTVDGHIYFIAEPGAKVVLNGQHKAGSVIIHASNYWVFKDFEIVGASSTGFQLSGSNNVVQNLKIHDNDSTGLQISRLAAGDRIPDRSNANVGELDEVEGITDWGDWPCDNKIINCDSYRNYDNGYNGADGFGAKLTCGKGNVFDGCASFWNADDGWDLYAKTSDEEGPIGRVTLKNCITFENGYEVRKLIDVTKQTPEYEADGYNAKMNLDADGKIILNPAGNGNGFKLGGSHLPGAHSISNSYAFYNACKGFDSNNGPDIKISGCTAYNNAEENVGLSTGYKTNNYLVEKTVSYKDDNAPEGHDGQVKMQDSNPTGGTSVYNYYQWNKDGTSKGVGTVSGEITAASFVSLDWDNTAWVNGGVRDADGSLNLGDFLKLTGAVADAGAGELVNDETVATPDAVENPPIETAPASGGSNGSSGNGGTLADAGKKDPDTTTEPTYTADKKTDAEGNTAITVTDGTGEVVADVKIPASIPAPEITFEDVPEDHWAADAINNMAGMNIVNGVGGNTFGTDSNLTRGQLATMLFRFANGKEGIANSFADVPAGQWYTDAIGWAAKVGVVTGYSAEAFGPNDTITREQLAVMLARFAKLVGMDTRVSGSSLSKFVDRDAVSDWAADGMNWCVRSGIINGVSADTLSPAAPATRAQTALMLDRFINLMK